MITQVKLRPLLLLTQKDQRRVYPLTQPSVTVGRSSACNIFICHGQVSRCQSVIRLSHCGSRFMIFDGNGEDRSSRNGTYLNWERVKWGYLEPEDVICFGSPAAVARFCWVESIEESLQIQPLGCQSEESPTQLLLPCLSQ